MNSSVVVAGCQNGTGQGQSYETVQFGDDKHTLAVSSAGASAVEKTIHILDSSPASGGEGGSEGTLGRQHSDSGTGKLGQISTELNSVPSSSLFFVDSTGTAIPPNGWEMFGKYTRNVSVVLGDSPDDEEPAVVGDKCCFNCGSTKHVRTNCPHPHNHELTRLTLDLFDFYKSLRSASDVRGVPRFHEVGEWRKKRLEWTDYFEPGKIKGELLKEAIGNSGGSDWLRNIARFGYPRGWTGDKDPKQKMRRRIMGWRNEDEENSLYLFSLFGDEEENVSVYSSSSAVPSTLASDSESGPRRWAEYPDSHFFWYRLFMYEPPPPQSSLLYITSVEERSLWNQELWERVLLSSPPETTLEQYYYHYFYYLYASIQPAPQPTNNPPPPTDEPPPLPPEVGDDDMDLSD